MHCLTSGRFWKINALNRIFPGIHGSIGGFDLSRNFSNECRFHDSGSCSCLKNEKLQMSNVS